MKLGIKVQTGINNKIGLFKQDYDRVTKFKNQRKSCYVKKMMKSKLFMKIIKSNYEIDKIKQEEEFFEELLSCYEEIDSVQKQLLACQQTTHNLISNYISELEIERTKVKKLNTILQLQERIIYKLDKKDNELLNILVDLQSIELLDKKNLILELTKERKVLLKKIENFIRPISPPLTPPPKIPIPSIPKKFDLQSCNSSISSFTKKFSTSFLKNWRATC